MILIFTFHFFRLIVVYISIILLAKSTDRNRGATLITIIYSSITKNFLEICFHLCVPLDDERNNKLRATMCHSLNCAGSAIMCQQPNNNNKPLFNDATIYLNVPETFCLNMNGANSRSSENFFLEATGERERDESRDTPAYLI